MHIDPALQAMIDQSSQSSASAACQSGHVNAQSSPDTMTGVQGSYASASPDAPPFPDSVEDVSMESSADKRSRVSPDSTLKPQGESLKTSGVATATSTEGATPSVCAVDTATCDEGNDAAPEIPTIRWRAREVAETRVLMRQLQNRMPAWKLKTYIEALRTTPVDLARIGEATGIQFDTVELVKVAVQCLDEIASEANAASVAGTSGVTAATSSHDNKQDANDKSDSPEPENEPKISVEESTDKSESHKEIAEQCATAQGSSQSVSPSTTQHQDASASRDGSDSMKEGSPTKGSPKDWVARLVKSGHNLLWPSDMTMSIRPTLLTGVKRGESDYLIDDLMEWERKFETANLENHKQFLRDTHLTVNNHPMEAAAWENGYVPEAEGLSPDQLESRIQSSLPSLAYMVSRPTTNHNRRRAVTPL